MFDKEILELQLQTVREPIDGINARPSNGVHQRSNSVSTLRVLLCSVGKKALEKLIVDLCGLRLMMGTEERAHRRASWIC